MMALDRIGRALATPRGFIAFLGAYILLQFALRGYLLPCASGDDMVQLDLSTSLEWGYGTRNPPLYTWLVIAARQVFGATLQAVTLVKFAAMFLMYLFLYLAARRVLGDGPLALLAALSPLAVNLVAWDSVTNYSHTVLATAMYAATFYALLRIDADGRPVSYALFGIFLGLGLLSKYTFALFALALLAAALTDKELRGRLLNPKASISAAIALAIVAPYLLTMLDSADSMTALSRDVFAIAAGQDRLGAALRGLDKFASGYLNFLFPLALLLPLGFARAFRRLSAATPPDRWMRILGLSFIIMTAVYLAIILGAGATQFRKHYILVFILSPIYFFARARAAGFAQGAPARFTGVLLIVALLGLGAVTAKYTLEPGRCMRALSSSSHAAERQALGHIVAHEPDHQGAGHDGKHAGGGEQAPVEAGGADRARHGGGDGIRDRVRQRARQQKLDPRKHETEEGRDADAGTDQRQENGQEETGEPIAVEIGGLVYLARHAGHEAFQDPHRQRHVEQGVRQRHRDVRVDQAECGIELEEGQQKDRRRRHAVGQQPEEHVFVAEEPVAREGVGGG